jgi:hypothetical protein
MCFDREQVIVWTLMIFMIAYVMLLSGTMLVLEWSAYPIRRWYSHWSGRVPPIKPKFPSECACILE